MKDTTSRDRTGIAKDIDAGQSFGILLMVEADQKTTNVIGGLQLLLLFLGRLGDGEALDARQTRGPTTDREGVQFPIVVVAVRVVSTFRHFENVIVVVVVSNGIVLAGVDNGVVELFGALVNARTWSLQMRIGVRYEQVLTAIV